MNTSPPTKKRCKPTPTPTHPPHNPINNTPQAIPSAAFRTPPHHTHTTPDSHEEEEDEEGGSLSVVVPHALADHCPALQGPLVVQVPAEKGGDAAESRGGMLEYCEDDDVVVSMINMRYDDGLILRFFFYS